MANLESGNLTDELAASLTDRGIKYCLAEFVDLHGIQKCKSVPIAHFSDMMAGSEMFTGAALDGVPQAVNDDEVCAMPDPSSTMVLPWNREVAWLASDLYLDGKPFSACSRKMFKRALKVSSDMGFVFNLGIETDFLYSDRQATVNSSQLVTEMRWTSLHTIRARCLLTTQSLTTSLAP
jgi:glutamine synthetase